MTKQVLERMQRALTPFVGCDIDVDANIGRKRIIPYKGTLEATYHKVFVVRLNDEDCRRMSFNYVDLMTGNVVVALRKDGHTYRLSNKK